MTGDRRSRPNVFSIPAGAPFLPTLADALLDGRLAEVDRSDPLGLADVTILLPTRRAVRALRDLLAERLGRDAAILPSVRPIGDADEEAHLLDPGIEAPADRLTLPPAVSPLARQLILTELTLAWGRTVRNEMLRLGPSEEILIPASPADAARLAADLARLIDDMAIAGLSFDAVARLAPDDQTGYFRVTLDFLKIAAEFWPRRLTELGRADPTARRDALIRAEAIRLPGRRGVTIAAGSTGSIPATAELLKAIAHLPRGAVVLPGLDTGLDDAAWAAIGGDGDARAWGHPQAALKQLIATIGIARDEVEALGESPPALALRTRIVAEAMRPAETTDAWSAFRQMELSARSVEAGLAGVGLVVARNEQEEALAIALAFRQALEDGVRIAALATPDRTLARRVAAELSRWGLVVDDSAGAPLSGLPEGIFARLLVETVFGGADPVTLLALLKHPLAAFGMARPECRRAARALELALFRGRRVTGGIAGLKTALEAARAEADDSKIRHPSPARQRLWPEDWDRAALLVESLARVLGPLEAALGEGQLSVAVLSQRLLAALTQAADDGAGVELLWATAGGTALAGLVAGLAEEGDGLRLSPDEFPPFLDALLAGVAVPRRPGADPRIHIWGTLEARLQSVDLLILGGLDEGVWPAEPRTDPFLSRTMRAEVGLPPPERRIGQAAHDFAAFVAAPRVIVTRALKRGGTPTVESRWLQRLAALIGGEAAGQLTARGDTWRDLARRLDVPAGPVKNAPRPMPKPPLAVRPKRLSITEIETLIRDPYAIYAKHILKLRPLDPLGKAPDYATRGTIVHEALGSFIKDWTGSFDEAAEARLRAIGAALLEEIAAFPDVHAVWSLRFQTIARWFIAWERARASSVKTRHAEIEGALVVPLASGAFTLRGRADRIDLMGDGTLAIYDFKTGSPPAGERSVFAGLTPQMTLEAAMARAGAFDAGLAEPLASRSVADLAWLGLGKAGRGEPYQSAVAANRKETADELADRAHVMLVALLTAFDDEAKPYLSRARPLMINNRRFVGDYDHLARVREWALVESHEDEIMAGPPS
ncbi:MAG: double-strand break repair protein AddB [Bauldia sp.]